MHADCTNFTVAIKANKQKINFNCSSSYHNRLQVTEKHEDSTASYKNNDGVYTNIQWVYQNTVDVDVYNTPVYTNTSIVGMNSSNVKADSYSVGINTE